MMQRRAQAEMMEWFPRIIMLVVAVIVITVLVNYYSNRDVEGDAVERAAMIYRLYYDGNLIMYKDPLIGRTYPGIIDLERFDEKRLADTYSGRSALSDESRIAACLELNWTQGRHEPRVICTDRRTFEKYSPLAQSGLFGAGGASMERASFPVTIKDKSSLAPGTLTITVVRRNT
ncbi:TPA: hypothetical protein HA251_01100 [Candidatus Woesearchaeota archaeon]|nr:hypothetical protein [Candidatus Woesearchaeota archaeon]